MPEWNDVSALPESGAFVLAVVVTGKRRSIVRAIYARKFELTNMLDDEGGEYDEETDEYYCEPGWYECNAFEEVHWAVDGIVTHWMPLPPLPGERAGGAA